MRPQIAESLGEDQFRRALQDLAEAMALVPEGEVLLGQIDESPESGDLDSGETAASQVRAVRVEPLFLDRYPVTNAQFYEFVAAGGYQDAALWDTTILPAVLGFVDRTGAARPSLLERGLLRCRPRRITPWWA